jgi:hypothetical protein
VLLVAASSKNCGTTKTLGKFGAFLLDADFGRHAKLMINKATRPYLETVAVLVAISRGFLDDVAGVGSHEVRRNEFG